jgi:hypothetical protein
MRISLEKLVEHLYTTQLQSIMDAVQTMLSKWDIDNIEGEPLKEIGRIIGLKVFPTDTDTLRAFIYAKTAINSSKGRFSDIYAVAQGLCVAFGGTTTQIIPYHPLQLNILMDTVIDPAIAGQLVTLLQDASAVEVKIAGIESITTDGDGIFKYDSSSALDAYDAGVYTDFMRNR